MIEEFRKIYDGYEVSNHGNLKRNGVLLTTPIGASGYKRKYLKDLKQNILIHREVARVFIPNPDNKPQVNHKNGIKTDNGVENLEWATRSENQLHAVRTGLRKIYTLEDSAASKLTNVQVIVIREAIRAGHKQKAIAKYFGLNQSTISLIKSGKNWSTL